MTSEFPLHKGEPMTPEELGELFAHLASDEQARFFNGVAKAAKTFPGPWEYGDMQWVYLADEMRANPDSKEGLAVMQSMSAFALLHAWGY